MGLFQKQPIRQEIVLPYTLSHSATRSLLIVGLGNVGKNYAHTRHNAGFLALDYFAKQNNFPAFAENKKFKGNVSVNNIGTARVILLKPSTFMNDSGQSVQSLMRFYKLQPQDITVVHDELSIDFGQIRTRVGGQAAGHNGIKSIIDNCGENFGRVRIGIKNEPSPKTDSSVYVLSPFSDVEQSYLEDIWLETNSILIEYIYGGQLPHDTRSIVFDYEND